MSNEETKREAEKTVVAVTDEVRLYRDAVSDYNEARNSLKQWEANHQGFSPIDPELLQLKQWLKDANQLLNDAERRWKDARAASGETSKRQKVEKIGLKWKNESEEKIAYEGETKWEWKEVEEPPIYSLKNLNMYFVNRDRAVQQLQNIHEMNYIRAINHVGKDWIIPIADNVIGLGKSSFGKHYIRKCREAWTGVELLSDFQKTLMDCHTVHLLFKRGELLENPEMKIYRQLCETLRGMFIKPPAILSNETILQDETNRVYELLEEFTKKVGPLFIVLDEIGVAFNHKDLDVVASRECFMDFCLEIIGNWLPIKNVFFLLLGRASFLSYVGQRPEAANLTTRVFSFSRLSIHLLRPEAIKTIMEKTIANNENMTIKEACGLTDTQLDEIANDLFRQTCGHPRSLLDVFNSCRTYDELKRYVVPEPPELEKGKIFGELRKYKKTVVGLLNAMSTGSVVDLTQKVEDPGKKMVPRDIIANNCCVAWAGTVDQATLYAPPYVQELFMQYVFPLKDYVRAISGVVTFSIDYPTVFEWICLKRFQEMFSSPISPAFALPEFFNSTQKFGKCNDVTFANDTRRIPKITRNGTIDPNLDSLTADPSAWPDLLQKIEKEITTSVCLKPRPKSSSSDALLMTQNGNVRLTLGLAVKNFNSTEFSKAHLTSECEVFNRMFDGGDMERLNVLVVCATKYSKMFAAMFNKQRKSVTVDLAKEKYPYIHEMILLDLSTTPNRKIFFGFREDDVLSNALDEIISKEVEFNKE